MNILMIDTSGPACGVAIMADGRLIYEAELVTQADAQPARYADGRCGIGNERHDGGGD